MTDRATEIATSIKQWDRQNIKHLRSLIRELDAECREHHLDSQAYIDMTSLPSAEIPDDVDAAYPVWAMDAHENMLVGAAADETMTLAEYRGNH